MGVTHGGSSGCISLKRSVPVKLEASYDSVPKDPAPPTSQGFQSLLPYGLLKEKYQKDLMSFPKHKNVFLLTEA